MKKAILISAFISVLPLIEAMPARIGALPVMTGEITSATIIYERVIQMDIQLEGMGEEIAAALPKEQRTKKVLYFSGKKSMYENYREEESAEEIAGEEHGIRIMVAEPEHHLLTDMEEQKSYEQKEFMSRLFLIETDLEAGKWKLSGKQRTILEHRCHEAVSGEGEKEIRVWFTPDIPLPFGPAAFNQLPGLVLAVERDGGKESLTAISIEPGPVEEKRLKKPGKGKKVSEEEYEAIVAEKMKEMGGEGGAGGENVIMIKISQ